MNGDAVSVTIHFVSNQNPPFCLQKLEARRTRCRTQPTTFLGGWIMRRLLLTFGLLSLLSVQAFGQSTNATVSGTVGDATGAVLPGVEVTATNNGTGVVTTVLTNESGAYNIGSLLPGVYKVSASL